MPPRPLAQHPDSMGSPRDAWTDELRPGLVVVTIGAEVTAPRQSSVATSIESSFESALAPPEASYELIAK
jgi:hypothetical protein